MDKEQLLPRSQCFPYPCLEGVEKIETYIMEGDRIEEVVDEFLNMFLRLRRDQ